MSLRSIFYAYILGGFTFIPLLLCALIAFTLYTSEPIPEDPKDQVPIIPNEESVVLDVQDSPKTRKGWLTVRRNFEESAFDGGYVNLVRSFLDARSKDPKRSRPKDMWYVVLKGQILYLYEDEAMTDCEAAIQLGSHDVVIFPEGLLDGELFTKRNALFLKPKKDVKAMPSVTRGMKMSNEEELKEGEKVVEARAAAREQAVNTQTPWFIFVRSTVEMEDWYFALLHASRHPPQTPTLDVLQEIFLPSDMNLLVSTLDEQPDVIPMRWFNALFGRIFYSFYKTEHLESFIIGRLMKKLSKVKRPSFLNDIIVTEVSVGNRTPVFSKPMLKELSKEGDAAMEVHVAFKGEVRITVQATATINLGARFKSYTVKLILAAVLRELEGNLLVKVKRPPSNRIWYAFTQMPKMVLNVEPIVSDRQITWSMILSTIESSLKTIIQESIVMPNMDDIAFFETVKRAGMSRGGVWPDAARKRGSTELLNEEPPALVNLDLPIQDSADIKDSAELASQPVVPMTGSLSETSSSTAEVPFLAPSLALPEESTTRNTMNRRKTWFSSVRDSDPGLDSEDNPSNFEIRGRALDMDASRTITTRSQSTPKAENVIEKGEDEDVSSQPIAESIAKQRSTSQGSSIRETGISTGLGNAHNHTETEGSSLSASTTTSTTPPSPTNFFTTLKSRDKQALSNSAKEAMRKWGMKWGNLNKDFGTSSSDGTPMQHEDMPDHDTTGDTSGFHTRPRTTSALSASFSGTQKQRASYAEVRAAVAERRERSEGFHNGSLNLVPPSNPIAIPSSNLLDAENGLPSFPSVSLDSLSPLNKSTPDVNRGNAPSLASTSSSSSSDTPAAISGVKLKARSANPDLPDDDSSSTHLPIHIQPQSKTMSIPGIHARHRGEIMSLGFSPPQEGQGQQRNITGSQGSSTLAVSMGSLTKNPKIQSMYRLWKQASSNSNAEDNDTKSQINSEREPEFDAALSTTSSSGDSINTAQSSVSLPPSMSSLSKRSPAPPLPPRPSPVTISPSRPPPLPSRTPSRVSGSSTDTTFSAPSEQSLSPPLPIVSSAQDALKVIATKDDHTRKRASLTISSTNNLSESLPAHPIPRLNSSPSSPIKAHSGNPTPASDISSVPVDSQSLSENDATVLGI
ncbi:hypothetical protein D9757_002261 [Collybiopsis confluens]|uniref:SMP-LTD domain-containing protein n=1 Tax=Collybiopsis confluens TaxID=2823264 RepID=A0A8H5HZX4_9AGAR|nr:hypothetical protein D9757_002261 [Collybiopsis confluens]